jgi:hypothetical protein
MAFPVEILGTQNPKGLIQGIVFKEDSPEHGHLPFKRLGRKFSHRNVGHRSYAEQ